MAATRHQSFDKLNFGHRFALAGRTGCSDAGLTPHYQEIVTVCTDMVNIKFQPRR